MMTIYVNKKRASKELIKSRLFIQKEIEDLVDIARSLELCDTEKSVVSTLKMIKGVAINIVDEVTEIEQEENAILNIFRGILASPELQRLLPYREPDSFWRMAPVRHGRSGSFTVRVQSYVAGRSVADCNRQIRWQLR